MNISRLIIGVYMSIYILIIPPLNFLILFSIFIFNFFMLKKKIKNTRVCYLMLILILFQLLSMLFSIDLMRSFKEILGWVMILCLICIFDEGPNPNKTIEKLEIGGVISGIVIIIQSIFKISINDYIPIFSIPGTNNISLYFLLLSLITIKEKKKIMSIYFLGLIVFLGSRAIILFEVLYLVYKNYRNKKVIFLAFIFSIFNFQKIINLFKRLELNSITNFQDNYSNLVRINIWKDCINDYLNKVYIFGIGGGSFKKYYLKIRSINFEAEHPHNFYLNILIENGLLSFIYIIIIIIIIIIYVFNKKYKYKTEISYYILLLLVYGFFESITTDSRVLMTITILFLLVKNFKKGDINENNFNAKI